MTSFTITTPGTGHITVGGSGPNDPPAGTTSIVVEAWSNGASAPAFPSTQEGGGASGAYTKTTQAVVNGDVLTYSVEAGRASGNSNPASPTYVMKTGANPYGGFVVRAQGASTEHNLSYQGFADGFADVVFNGASGAAAQGGGGKKGGSGGSSCGSPAGPGVQGSPGSRADGGAGAPSTMGAGGTGGAAGASGSDGGHPGGGGGGGGSGAGMIGGRGGDGQIRFTW